MAIVSHGFIGIVQTLEKISKNCVIHLTTEKIEFILASTSEMSDGIQVWAGMNQVGNGCACEITTSLTFLAGLFIRRLQNREHE